MNAKKEQHGVAYGLLGAAVGSLWPVLIHQGTQKIAPISFTAIVSIIATVVLFIYAVSKGKFSEIKKKKAYLPITIIALCSVIIPPVLIAIGSKYTSGTNTSMLILTEILYSVIFTHFIGEKTTMLKICGALGVLAGAILIIYKGNLDFNKGDIIIALAPITYPFGSFYSKKVLHHVSSKTLLWIRYFIGSVVLVIFSQIFEPQEKYLEIIQTNWPLLIFFAIVVLAIGKSINYESFKRLDISKFIAIGMTAPFFSLIMLTTIFHEKISQSQWIGIAVMAIGVYLSIKRTSTHSNETMYGKDHL
ncbi:MAG: DMT family transporter [Patescibacteria group bacterium]